MYIYILEMREEERLVSAFAFSLEQNLIWRTISQHPFAGQFGERDAPVGSDLTSGRGQISRAGEVIARSQWFSCDNILASCVCVMATWIAYQKLC